MAERSKEDVTHAEDSAVQQDPSLEKGGSAYDKYRTEYDDPDRAPEARARDVEEVDAAYWRSPRFLGSMAAIGLGFCGGTGGFALIAPVLSDINDDIGPSDNVAWVSIVYILSETVFFLLVGRLSDIFGRRWFFITGSLISMLGSIVGATAQSINQLIAAEVLIGVAAAFQISFYWVISELVPMRWRYVANSYAYMVSIPTNPLAAKIAFAFQQTPVKWRGSFYFMIGINALSALCWFLFYHPPTFKMLHRKRAAKDLFLHFDWIGLLLFTASLTVFLLALSWGGQLYPWSSSHVVGCIVSGGVALFGIFPAWELWLQKKGKDTFLPLHLFTNPVYQACVWITGIGAATYYGFSLVWPQAVANIYQPQSLDRQGTLAGLVAMCFVFGQMLGGLIATVIGPRFTVIGCMWIAAPIYLACATNPLSQTLTMGLITTGSLAIGAAESVAATTSTFNIRTQEEMGTAGGLSGCIRSFVSAVATAIYSTVLANRLSTTVPNQVGSAATDAGLPASSVPALIAGLQGAGSLTAKAVPGLTAAISATAAQAYKVANADAYKTVFYTSFAFGGAGMILSWLIIDNDKTKQGLVAGHVHDVKKERQLEQSDVVENT